MSPAGVVLAVRCPAQSPAHAPGSAALFPAGSRPRVEVKRFAFVVCAGLLKIKSTIPRGVGFAPRRGGGSGSATSAAAAAHAQAPLPAAAAAAPKSPSPPAPPLRYATCCGCPSSWSAGSVFWLLGVARSAGGSVDGLGVVAAYWLGRDLDGRLRGRRKGLSRRRKSGRALLAACSPSGV